MSPFLLLPFKLALPCLVSQANNQIPALLLAIIVILAPLLIRVQHALLVKQEEEETGKLSTFLIGELLSLDLPPLVLEMPVFLRVGEMGVLSSIQGLVMDLQLSLLSLAVSL